jgi:hypothetical protein
MAPQTEFGLHSGPRNGSLAGGPHLRARPLGLADVYHVLSEFKDAVQVIGINDGGDPMAMAGEIDRLVLGTNLVDDRGKPLLSVGHTVPHGLVASEPVLKRKV